VTAGGFFLVVALVFMCGQRYSGGWDIGCLRGVNNKLIT
jgi:hypothetical protein